MSSKAITAGDTVELRMAARPENVALARLALAGVASATGAPADVVADLKLAVSEGCTNAVQHAYAASGEGSPTVVLRFTGAPGRLTVEIEDEGGGFDAAASSSWDVERDDRGIGMGLTIIRSVTDELTVESGPLGSRVSFSKRF